MKRIYEDYKPVIIYTMIAAMIGIIIGAVDALFGEVLLMIADIRHNHILQLVPFLPVAGLFIIFLYKKFSQESLKGMSLVFQTGFGVTNRIPKMLVPLVILSTWLTHLFGGSAGREGVAVQLGATISHSIGQKLKLQDHSRILLISGMAAGFAGLFQTPIAATFFAMEVLVVGTLQYQVLLPALAASLVSSYTSHKLGLEKFSVNISDSLDLSGSIILKLIVIGIIFGITGGLFAHMLSFCKKYFETLIYNPMKRIAIIGSVLAVLFIILHLGRYTGLGTNLIQASFSNEKIYSYDFILKILLTIVTLSAGFQGGEVTPLFSIGSSLGIVLGTLLGMPLTLTAALGYAAVFGSATNTLLAPILIGAEVFGSTNIIYFTIVCSIAFVFNGNKTIYTSQKNILDNKI